MNRRWKLISLLLVLALATMYAPAVFAQDDAPILECSGEGVEGTVIAVDPATGVVTVKPVDGEPCTVTLNGSYDHPIVTLLGQYFGDISADSFVAALSDTQGCALMNADESWSWVDCGTAGSQEVHIISYDDLLDTFTVLMPDGSTIEIALEGDAAGKVLEALKVLGADWALDGEGDVVQVSDEVAMYHNQGMGFGVLVKLYAIAYTSGEPVEDLVGLFQSGIGMGQIFKEHGKPTATGVGHLRPKNKTKDKEKDKAPETSVEDPAQEPSAETAQPQTQPADKGKDKVDKNKKSNTGVCNAQANNGKAKAKGKPPASCP